VQRTDDGALATESAQRERMNRERMNSPGSTFTELRYGTEGYPGSGTGAGLSGAPPTETGPKGLGSVAIVFRCVRKTRARKFECGMLEVVNGGIALCRASVCAASEVS
jgi:hypothetical protein